MNIVLIKKAAMLIVTVCGLGASVGATRLSGSCVTDGNGWVSANGGCMDTATGLVWGSAASSSDGQRDGYNVLYTYYTAQNFCTASTEGGASGWRVPTLAEMKTAQQHGAINHVNLQDSTGQLWDTYRWSIDTDKSKKYGYWLRFGDGATLKVLIKANIPGGGTSWSMTDAICVR